MNLDDLKGEILYKYIRENKEDILKAKRTSLAVSPPVEVAYMPTSTDMPTLMSPDKTSLEVKMVCSTSWLCNSHMDVLTDTAYADSIAKRGTSIHHIVDHRHEAAAHVGDVTKVYTEMMSLEDLGYPGTSGQVTALIMESTVRKDYNTEVFKFYANGKINQHSIGFMYEEIALAVNSTAQEDAMAKAVWDEYYPKVINKATVDSRGFFYLVSKIDIVENSAVLFGSNFLTPTLSVASLATNEVPLPQPIGNSMTLEEAQGKIIALTEELALAKASIATSKLEAAAAEKARGLNILKAQATFGTDSKLQKAALSFIEKGLDVDTAITSFEVIKEAIQGASHVDTTLNGLNKSIEKSGDDSFLDVLDKALDKGLPSADRFAGIK
jgi:hypothetical protein